MQYRTFREMFSEMSKPRGQTGLEAKNLASALKLSGLGLEVLASVWRHSGLEHKLLASVSKFNVMLDEPSKQLLRYITYINSDTFDHSSSELAKLL